MWQTERLRSSHSYMSRVHGLVNDSSSTASTPSRSSSPSSRSIQYCELVAGSGISGELRIGATDVEWTDCVWRRLVPGSSSGGREHGDRAGEQRRDGIRKRRGV